jgi:hypothetical protein
VRELPGIAKRRSPAALVAATRLGIALDKAIRMKPSFEDLRVNRWPPIEISAVFGSRTGGRQTPPGAVLAFVAGRTDVPATSLDDDVRRDENRRGSRRSGAAVRLRHK